MDDVTLWPWRREPLSCDHCCDRYLEREKRGVDWIGLDLFSSAFYSAYEKWYTYTCFMKNTFFDLLSSNLTLTL